MKNFKDVIKLTVGGILIFIFGLYMGSELDFTSLSSIEGYLYGASSATPSDATSGNATSANATSGNATSGNATSGNATSGNATSGNATSGNATSGNSSSPSSSSSSSSTPSSSSTKKTVTIDNNKTTAEKVIQIRDEEEGTNVVIDATNDSKISASMFDAIKGTKKSLTITYGDYEMIFNGDDIKVAKDIDATIKVSDVSKDSVIGDEISGGVLITFANNGNLPGTATVRIKNNALVDSLISNKVYVYYYNEDTNKYVLVNNNVRLVDGYYEFTITHHSKYIMVDDEIVNAEVEVDGKTKVSFQKSKTFQILLICGGVVVVIAVIVAMVIIKKKKNKKEDNSTNTSEADIPEVTELPWDKEQK